METGITLHAPESEPRFAFGRNWRSFLGVLSEERIRQAERSLAQRLGRDSLAGQRFLDIGSGSGLFSLAARRLGAVVHSFDYDEESVACTRELRRRCCQGDPEWQIERGSVLDGDYMRRLGQFDVVYSWGVLHHTGKMWEALDNAAAAVAPRGTLFVAIYNHQHPWTAVWTSVKRLYNVLPRPLRLPFALLVLAPGEARTLVMALLRRDPAAYVRGWTRAGAQPRGMSRWHDVIDWIGGYPFETAKPEEIFAFCDARGFRLIGLTTCGGAHGCNEYVFRRDATPPETASAAV